MTIVYCIASTYNSGGKDRVICTKANHLVQLGHKVTIITTDQKERPSFFPLDPRVRCIDLGINYEDYNSLSFWARYRKSRELKLKHRGALIKALEATTPSIVISTFEEDAEIVADLTISCPKIMELHYSKERRFNEYPRARWSLGRLLDHIRTWRDEWVVRKFDHLVTLTEVDRTKWTTARSSSTIPNPLPFVPTSQSSPLNKRVIAVGRYSSEKDFASLIHIWSKIEPKHPEWELEIVGDGYLRKSFEDLISSLHLKRVLLSHPTADIQSKYLSASCLAMTSRYEGFGMVLIEAMAHGLPVIAYDCPYGPREIIRDKQSGFLIPPNNRSLYRESLELLMDNSDLRTSMGIEALRSSERYSMNSVMEQWIQLFESLYQSNTNS